MRINRYKRVNKILNFYTNHFGFRKPYQVLVDATICAAALKNKVNIQNQFTKYLDGEVKLLTTSCIVLEAENLGPIMYGAATIVKQFAIHQCGHRKEPVSGSQCLLDMIGDTNSARYVIASQDEDLRKQCRIIQGVPLLHLHSAAPTLEHPSTFTKNVASSIKSASLLTDADQRQLEKLNAKLGVANQTVQRKRKMKGGPNPLSCKKKKKTESDQTKPKKESGNKKKRIRKKNRVVKRIKSELKL